jgi:hypothetical protein
MDAPVDDTRGVDALRDQSRQDRQQRDTLALDLDVHRQREPTVTCVDHLGKPTIFRRDQPGPKICAQLNLPALGFEHAQITSDKGLPALSGILAVESKDPRATLASGCGSPHHGKAAAL